MLRFGLAVGAADSAERPEHYLGILPAAGHEMHAEETCADRPLPRVTRPPPVDDQGHDFSKRRPQRNEDPNATTTVAGASPRSGHSLIIPDSRLIPYACREKRQTKRRDTRRWI